MKCTTGILELKDMCDETKPPITVAGKVSKKDVPGYYGNYVRYKLWKAEFL